MSADMPLTALIEAWHQGDGRACRQLFDSAYAELKQIAAQRLRHAGADLTLTPTVLLHEAWLRVAGQNIGWKDRAHFFASMSLYIRSVLVDYARARQAQKRAHPELRVSLADDLAGEESMVADLLALDQALARLEHLDPRCAEVLHLNCFGGLDREQITVVLGISMSSVDRDLRFARLWLREELARG